MRFLLDMGIPHGSVTFLMALGHEATHLRDFGLTRLPDPDILRKALAESRVVVRHDLDFGELLAASGGSLPSVISFRLRDMRPKHLNGYLKRILNDHQDALRRGAILSVTEDRIRVRALPIQPR